MTTKDQMEFLGLDKLNALDVLSNKLNPSSFQLTGSISLFEFDIVKREISDIDIVVNSLDRIKRTFDKKEYDLQEWFDYSDKMENPKNTDQEKGKVTNRISFKINDVKICAFYSDEQRFKICNYMLDRKFKVSNPRYSIEAKEKYIIDLLQKENLNKFQIKKLEKHSSDIIAFYKKYQ